MIQVTINRAGSLKQLKWVSEFNDYHIIKYLVPRLKLSGSKLLYSTYAKIPYTNCITDKLIDICIYDQNSDLYNINEFLVLKNLLQTIIIIFLVTIWLYPFIKEN